MITKNNLAVRRCISIILTVVLCLTSFIIVNPFKAEAIVRTGYEYGHYYSYPAGTQFLTSLRVGTGSSTISSKDAKNRAQQENHTLIDVDLRKGGGGRYMYLGYQMTDDINAARTYIVISNEASGSVANTSESPTSRFYVPDFSNPGNYFNPSFVIVNGNNSNDLRSNLGGNDCFIYYTQDAKAGLPITRVDVYAESEADAQSQKGEYWKQAKDVTNGMGVFNLNQSGKGTSRYLYFDNTSAYTDVTTNINNLKSAVAKANALTSSNYTTASWSAVTTALNSANSLINQFNNTYKIATVTAAELDEATNNLNSALNGLVTVITINASANGGACSTASVEIACGLNTSVTFPGANYTASKANFEFLGWNTDVNAHTGSKGNVTVGLKGTVYAIFKTTVSANFNFMDASGVEQHKTAQTDIYNKDTFGNVTVDGVAGTVSKAGRTYKFAGWNESTSATTASVTSNALRANVAEVKNYYAVYTTDYTLSYDANTGNNAPAATTATVGANYNTSAVDTGSASVTADAPSKTGYTFMGWADTADASSAAYNAGSVIALNADRTVYAVWSINSYKVIFINSVTGEKLGEQGVNYLGSATAPSAVNFIKNDENTHWQFKGWDKNFSAVEDNMTVNTVYEQVNHTYILKDSKEATCTENGFKAYECADCGQTKTDIIPATNHAGKQNVEEQSAACTETGFTAGVYCPDCDTWLSGHEVIPVLGHDNDSEMKEVKAADCTNEGLKEKRCSRCGELLATEKIEPLGHKYNETADSTIPATCSKTGSESFNCIRCDYVDVRELAVDPNNHINTMNMSASDPGCVTVGYTAGVYCKDCRSYISGHTEISATGHKFPESPTRTIKEADCVSEGEVEFVCENCNGGAEGGIKTEKTKINPDNHQSEETYLVNAKEATCTEKGYTGDVYYACCNTKKADGKETDPLGHDMDDGVITKPATVTEKGIKTFSCKRCDYSYTEEVELIEHTCTGGTATCAAKAKCTVCGHEYGEIDPDNHINISVLPAVQADCQKTGLTEGKKCNDCLKILVEQTVTEKTGHTPKVIPAIPSTCTVKGMTEGSECTVCGKILKAPVEAELAAHTPVEIPAIAGNCQTEGFTAGSKCSVCNAVIKAPVSLGFGAHNEVDIPAVASTCTVNGSHGGKKCTVCGITTVAPQQSPLAEHKGVKIPGTPSTCNRQGKTDGMKCSECGKILVRQEVLPFAEHNKVEIPGIAATCTEKGRTAGIKCSVCNTVIVAGTEIPAKGHKEVQMQGRKPTCTRDGLSGGTHCEACGTVFSAPEIIPATGHSFDNGVTVRPADENQKGIVRYTCTVCGYYYDQMTDVTAHIHRGGTATCVKKAVCTVCGEAYGDYDFTNHSHEIAIPDIEPTCTLKGSKGGTKCADCGNVITPATEIPALGHKDEDGDGYCDIDGVNIEIDGVTWETFRCKACDKYDVLKAQPVIGWIYAIVHFFIHLVEWIKWVVRL